ncbi:M56 family metallopeptidase [Glaciihabitans sp. UYNi722]|uniref:M56 family metallopeptidase n=1 Tax=Glaciihabitans sp. UYNi722 TaxID=3156344 RepID=UPI0033920577
MIVALVLIGYSVLLAVVGPRLLLRAEWVDRAPRLGIAAWQALTVTVLASVVMAGLALTVPTVQISGDLAALLRSCVMALREQYASPWGAAAGVAGAIFALAIIGRFLWFLGAAITRMVRERTRHGSVLDMVGRRDAGRGIVILECDDPAVYCLPGRHRRIVVTTAALRALDEDQLDAVLAHERAHLGERHDLVLALATALATAFSGLKVFGQAAAETARLVELRADDVAAERTNRLTVAGALLAVAATGTLHRIPAVALAAGGAGAAARVRRLLPPHNPLSRLRAATGSLAVALLLALPVLVLGSPAVASMQHSMCPDAPMSSQM